jgi:hypothetical protein
VSDIRYEEKEKMSFEGAPNVNFHLVVRINNLDSENKANSFLKSMMKHSLCTYRVTRTSKPGMKRVAYKLELHCQHFQKKISAKQLEKACLARSKKVRKPFTMQVRNKKT